jgi:hypothetical protein
MKIAVYGVNAEIIALARAHDLTPIGVDRLVETLVETLPPFFTWEGNVDAESGEMLARMIVAAEPPGTTHYASRTQEGDKDLWSFWVSGDPQITLFTNSDISVEELRRMDWANAIGGSNS